MSSHLRLVVPGVGYKKIKDLETPEERAKLAEAQANEERKSLAVCAELFFFFLIPLLLLLLLTTFRGDPNSNDQ